MPSMRKAKKMTIPKAIMKEIDAYVRPPSSRKVYSDEIMQVMDACHEKEMRWTEALEILKKHYPVISPKTTASTLCKVYSQWKKKNGKVTGQIVFSDSVLAAEAIDLALAGLTDGLEGSKTEASAL